MAGDGDRRVNRFLALLLLAALATLAFGACHPQEPPGKRDGAVPREAV